MTEAGLEGSASAADLERGSTFGSYEIIRKLGEGGMGAVYEARRQGLDKRVALKVLTVAESAAMTARFVQEARIVASLEHPHVVDCFDVGTVDGTPFLVMELLEGDSLSARLLAGPMAVPEACDLMLPLCSAVAAAHDRGIVHRDLKPDNIFLAKKLQQVVPKVLDFGIAKVRPVAGRPGVTQTATILGTPQYMSPEQAADSKGVEASSDQFSMGAILWECLTGRQLFEGESLIEVLMKVVNAPIAPPSALAPGVPAALDEVVLRMLSRAPAQRFGTMRALGAALLPFASVGARARWAAEFGDVSHLATVAAGTPSAVVSHATAAAPDTLQASARSLPAPAAPTRSRWPAAAALGAVALLGLGAWRLTSTTPAVPAEAPRPASRPPRPVAPIPAVLAAPTPPRPVAPIPAVVAPPPAVAAPPVEDPPEAPPARGSHRRSRHPRLRHRNL